MVHPLAEKRRIKMKTNLEALKQEALEAMQIIPQENIVEPKMSILGPTMEASKFHIDEPEIRSMFAKLIAASIDSRAQNVIRSSFVEVVKQLEPLDASNLSLFKNERTHPCARYAFKDLANQGIRTILDLMFLANPNYPDVNAHASSLHNLKRLGLIDIKIDDRFTDDSVYEPFNHTSVASKIRRALDNGDYGPNTDFYIQKGHVQITSFGNDFISICL